MVAVRRNEQACSLLWPVPSALLARFTRRTAHSAERGAGKGGAGSEPIRPDTCLTLTHARMVSWSWRLLVTGGRNSPPLFPTAKRVKRERERGSGGASSAPWAQAASAPRRGWGPRGGQRAKEGRRKGGEGGAERAEPWCEAERGCCCGRGACGSGFAMDTRSA